MSKEDIFKIISEQPENCAKLLEWLETKKKEELKSEFYEAFSKMQAELPIIAKTNDVVFKGRKHYSFASIDNIVDGIKEVLKNNSFSFYFEVSTKLELNMTSVTCVLTYKNGYSIKSEFSSDIIKPNKLISRSQSIASTVTFSKRYALQNVTGVQVADEDSEVFSEQNEAKEKEEREEMIKKIEEIYKNNGKDINALISQIGDLYEQSIDSLRDILNVLKKKQDESKAKPVEMEIE